MEDSPLEPALGVITVGGEDPVPSNQVSDRTGTQTEGHKQTHTLYINQHAYRSRSHVMRNSMQIREKLLLMSKYLPLDLNLFFSLPTLSWKNGSALAERGTNVILTDLICGCLTN